MATDAMDAGFVTNTRPHMDANGAAHHLPPNERQIFDYLLKPDDIYDANGVYWADLPLTQRVKFVTRYDAKETRREWSNIGAMTKKDPLSPLAYYFRNMVLPGAGLGLEG